MLGPRDKEEKEQTALPPGEPELPEPDDFMTPVDRWRFRAFAGAGFDLRASTSLALSRADVHDVLRQLARGCSFDLAVKIFV